jgi:DNA-binding transcriptional regulator LsrR (DeoR family)
VKLYILVNYGPDGEPVLDMGGERSYNARRRIFTNEKVAMNYARKVGGAAMVIVGIGNEGEVSEVIDTRTIPAEEN